jgi:membrane protein YqaA with SNARE-associated domain
MASTIAYYFSLFISTLLAATILPLSSEIVFSSSIIMGYDPFLCILVASLGNCAGVTINYLIGISGINFLLDKLNFNKGKREYYHNKFIQYDKYLLLAAWLPIIGDPITIYAGIVRVRFITFALIVYTARILRYIIIYYLIASSVS